MSGGYFNYEDCILDDLADKIAPDTDGQTELTEQYRRGIARELRKLRKAMHSYDWYVSGDTSEDTFLEDMKALGIKPVKRKRNSKNGSSDAKLD